MRSLSDGIKKAFLQKKDIEGFTQRKFAQKLGISFTYMSELMTGKRRWNEDLILKACSILDVKISDIQESGSANKTSKPDLDPEPVKLYCRRLKQLYNTNQPLAFESVTRSIDDWLKASGVKTR
jgi:transcriptional regulator with XRE-family HTH domain